MKVCLVIAPFQNPDDARARIKDFLKWLSPLVDEVSIVTANFPYETINGEKIRIVNTKYNPRKRGALIQAIKHIFLQLNISLHLIKPALDSRVVIFWLSGTFALPMLVAKLLRRKLLLFVTGSWSEGVKYGYRKETYGIISTIFYHTVRILEGGSYILADKIILLSPALGKQVRQAAGNRCLSKCHIGVARPIDTNLFLVNKPLKERGMLIGYIGRFYNEKGLANLVKAFPLLLQKQDGLEFMLIGDGPLIGDIKRIVVTEGIGEKVSFTGWVPSGKVAYYLNQMKLLILPSYSKGCL